jgi:hypothetical protein
MDTEHGNSITHTGKQILSSGILFSDLAKKTALIRSRCLAEQNEDFSYSCSLQMRGQRPSLATRRIRIIVVASFQ